MIRVEGSVEIDRPIEQVWKFLTNIDNANKWDNGIVAASQTSDGPIGLGTTIDAVSESRNKRRILKVKVTEYDLNKRVAWTVADAGFGSGNIIYKFESVNDRTKLSKKSEIELKPFFKFFAPIIRRRLNESEIKLDLDNIKHNVEGRTK